MVVLSSLPQPPAAMRPRVTVDEMYRLYEERDPADARRMELIDGQIVFMVPPGPLQAGYTDETEDAIRRKVAPALRVRCQHPISINRHNEPQPDIAVVKQRKDAYTLSHPDPDDVLLIGEVSDSSLEFDLNIKRKVYAQADIPEYWVLDVNDRTLHVFLNPWQGDYTLHSTHKGDDEVACTTIESLRLKVSGLLPAI